MKINKRNIIHFLGGFTYDDFSLPQQAKIRQMQEYNRLYDVVLNRMLQENCRMAAYGIKTFGTDAEFVKLKDEIA